MKIYDALARGYLPKELPPCFSSEQFAREASTLQAPSPKKHWTNPATYVLGRPGGLRRRLAIPNPFSQVELCRLLETNWTAITSHLERSAISLSRPVVTADGPRALSPVVGVRHRPLHRTYRLHNSRFALSTDISQFYASVYTHSIEWALDGKAAAKASLRGSLSTFARELDKAVAAGQDGQTSGIPIGPDTSLVLAEILLTSVDWHLQDRYPETASGAIRYMDDLEFFTRSRSEAEDVLLEWESLLADLELVVNSSKTHIVEAPHLLEARWLSSLRRFEIRPEPDTVADLISFFTLAFDLAAVYPEDYVLSRALGQLTEYRFSPVVWSALIHLVLAAVVAEPTCLQNARALLVSAAQHGVELPRELLTATLNEIVESHARLEHAGEVSWALWILLEHRLTLSATAATRVCAMRDNASLLVLLQMWERGLVDGDDPGLGPVFERASAPEVTCSSDWLLAYECAAHGWTNPQAVSKEPQWKELLDRGVSFMTFGAPAPPATVARPPDTSDPTAALDVDEIPTETDDDGTLGGTPADEQGQTAGGDAADLDNHPAIVKGDEFLKKAVILYGGY